MNYTHPNLKASSPIREIAYLDENKNKCQECGQNHGFRPNFEGVKTSIEIIPLLIEKLRRRESLKQAII